MTVGPTANDARDELELPASDPPAVTTASATAEGERTEKRHVVEGHSEAAGDLAVRTVFEGGGIARHVFVQVTLLEEPTDPGGKVIIGTTDDRGMLLFRRIPAGPVVVETLRNPFDVERATIVRGDETQIELRLARGVRLTGKVVDAAGRAVAGALLEWVRVDRRNQQLVPCGTTDDDGRFALDGVPAGVYLGARKEGFAVSHFRQIAASDEGTEFVLVLDTAGGSLVGLVRDRRGRVAADAQVQVVLGGIAFGQMMSADNVPQARQNIWTARSDADGAFRIDGLPVGEWAVSARGPDASGWAGVATIRAGEETALEIGLDGRPELKLRVVEGADQRPVVGVMVYARWMAAGVSQWHETGPDGGVEFADANVGEYQITILDAARAHRRNVTVKGSASNVVVIELPEATDLSLIAVDEHGNPEPDIEVAVRSLQVHPGSLEHRFGGGWSCSAVTDEHGRATVARVPPDHPLELLATRRGRQVGYADGVVAGRGLVELRIAAAEPRLATLRGRVVGFSGGPVADPVVRVLGGRKVEGSRTLDVDPDGTFRAEVEPGSYELCMYGRETALVRAGPFSLREAEELDIGTATLVKGGRIGVRGQGQGVGDVDYWHIFDEQGREVGDVRACGVETVMSKRYQPGRYYVECAGHAATGRGVCTIEEDRDAQVTVTVTPGLHQWVRGRSPAGSGDEVSLELRADDGGEVIARRCLRAGPSGRWTTSFGVAPGDYVLRTAVGDETTTTPMTVTDGVRCVEIGW
ncbi:MAG: carboxypeptidase-like regulatory domain-containing protein [Planctomycetota bacterium]